ncbi:MAG TPA: prolipoprotein diacylglyceryl transferase [Phycisphaerae bacterium]|nr:prolipoprotein diacylglyceryl transferase [Phycisphaerae bacterium]HOJ75979.1 prolipoprotein diacylglyceryl transferase [Phycisphaerae bacterium]HOM53396.1 prolipoprotein diacylglyceryl transferase [Phycisphaerae bacterium]HON67330.1 prolipoprotein diacylglyceryl transferase [Phycisphaerae bacterium]HOQ86853.1 prolipoprotein diacylglyceryl transferase [Phycisphaerae bacterium]
MRPELFTIPGINFTVPGYGAMVLIAFLGGTWWMTLRARRVKVDPDIVLNLSFISLITSTIGARAFYVLHYWKDQFAENPARIFDLKAGGFEIYGGVIAAFFFCLLYGLIKRIPLRIYADVAMPSILLGMGIGRIGCFLFGCCWGSLCPAGLPWAVQFPYGSPPYHRQWENRQITTPAEFMLVDPTSVGGPLPRTMLKTSIPDIRAKIDDAAKKLAEAEAKGDEKAIRIAKLRLDLTRLGSDPLLNHYEAFETTPEQLRAVAAASPQLRSLPVHPSQIYGAIGPILLALITNAYFYRRRWHGTVMTLGFMLYAVNRFLEEAIRADNPHDTFGLTISQGVSIGVFVGAGLAWLALRALPQRSKAEPWKPETTKKEARPEPAAV